MRLQELITSTTKADVKIEMKRLNFKNNDENKYERNDGQKSSVLSLLFQADLEGSEAVW